MTALEIKDFIDRQTWTQSKTYAEKAPHQYIVRNKANATDDEFMSVVKYIEKNGFAAKFWRRKWIYLNIGDWFYWAIGDSEDDEEYIINRCNVKDYDLVFFKKD